MNTQETDLYTELKKKLNDATKRVIKKGLTKNKKKHEEYKISILNAYNEYIAYAEFCYKKEEVDTQNEIRRQAYNLRQRITIAFEILETVITLPERIFTPIEQREIQEIEGKLEELNRQEDIAETEENTMEAKREFLKMANGTINKNYSGDPLGLTAFINSIGLLESVTEQNQQGLLLTFVKTRLEGRAIEAIDNTVNTIDELITQLRNKIKPENSKVITGKMTALRMQRSNPQEFAKEAAELADALQRSLVIEGISYEKANEMTVDKTIEMCRASARSDVVRSILGAAQFRDPKEVVAKLMVETATDNTEKQVLAFEGANYRQNGYRGNNNNNRRPWRGGRGGNNRNNFNGQYNRGGFNNGSNYRGSHQYNGGRNSNYNRGDNQNRGNYNVRFTENVEEPAVVSMGNSSQDEENEQQNF